MENGNLSSALAYSKRGLRIFPLFYVLKNGSCSCRKEKCSRVGKHPTTRNGVQDATTDEASIRQWWTESPYANIGLATGFDGLTVVDIDDGIGKDKEGNPRTKQGTVNLDALISQYSAIPETLAIRTGSGGRHFYFFSKHQIPNSASKIALDIDVRGMGGYVILPPSNHASGKKYEWITAESTAIAPMPNWLEAKAMTGTRIDISGDEMQAEVVKEVKEKEFKLKPEQLVKLLDFIPPDCDREVWWKVGAALKKELGETKGFAAWDEWSRRAPDKYDSKVMNVQWNSFVDKGVSGGSIAHYAKDLGGFRGFDVETADSEEFKKWVYVAAIKRMVHLDTFWELDMEQFDSWYAPLFVKGKPSQHLLKNQEFRRTPGLTYWPEQPLWVSEESIEKLNYWRPSGVIAKKGNVDPFIEHIKYLYPLESEARILTQYLAYQVQQPGEKVHWALLLEGMPGTGKSFIAQVMRMVLGTHNVKMVTNEQLHETFTGWQRNTQLVVVEEMMAKGRMELMNKLKAIITEPWCSIREMYRPPYEQANRFNFLFFSNHPDSIVIDAMDRRYCVLKSKAEPVGKEYYTALFEWMRGNGPALLQFLNDFNLSDFYPKAHAPMTEGKLELIRQSMLPLDAFISDHVSSEEYPMNGDLYSLGELVEPLSKYNLRVNPKDIANSFRRLGYAELGRIYGDNDGQVDRDIKLRLWAVRNVETYRGLNAGSLRQAWIASRDTTPGGDDAQHEAILKGAPRNSIKASEPM